MTLVIDTIASSSLLDSAATAMILGTLLANRLDADLRVVTRSEPPVPSRLDQLLRLHKLELVRESQFRFVPRDDLGHEIDLLPNELVICTSWCTTAAVLPSVPASQIVYLLQEDERMTYAFGDERLRCERILRNRDIRFIVNSDSLLRHFVSEGFVHLDQRARSFEPAFPPTVFYPRPRTEGGRRKFVFYARPKDPRTLFSLGLEIITAAVARGWLAADEWDIVFVGSDIPDLELEPGRRPVRREGLCGSEYADLMGSADLGLSLMYTPHPGHPLLDMVASGAVVVTNRFGPRDDVSHRSANLISCDLDADALLKGLQQGLLQARDAAVRHTHWGNARLERDWQNSLRTVVDSLAGVH